MKLEDQVTSFELSKKLKKELVISLKSNFYWLSNVLEKNWYLSFCNGFNKTYHPEAMPAYTAEELLNEFKVANNGELIIYKNDDQSVTVVYNPEYGTDNSYCFKENNLADKIALAIIAQKKENSYNE